MRVGVGVGGIVADAVGVWLGVGVKVGGLVSKSKLAEGDLVGTPSF